MPINEGGDEIMVNLQRVFTSIYLAEGVSFYASVELLYKLNVNIDVKIDYVILDNKVAKRPTVSAIVGNASSENKVMPTLECAVLEAINMDYKKPSSVEYAGIYGRPDYLRDGYPGEIKPYLRFGKRRTVYEKGLKQASLYAWLYYKAKLTSEPKAYLTLVHYVRYSGDKGNIDLVEEYKVTLRNDVPDHIIKMIAERKVKESDISKDLHKAQYNYVNTTVR